MQKKCKHRIVNINTQNLQVFAKQHVHDQQKSICSKTIIEYTEKCDIVIRRSKNTSFTRI